MNKIKAAVLLLAAVVVTNLAGAQSLEDGKKFFYYEKYKSAKGVFEKLLAANANNTDAAYWLGQTLIAPDDNKDIAGAKEIYRKTLEANSNNALLTAGMGHIELLEGKTADARNRFETAVSLSQGKNIAVLNAIGMANSNFNNKNGDANYGIEKLKQATTLKGFKDPETYCLMGDAYRKLIDGGNAITSYQSALGINPKYARALYRIGKVYQTQGVEQKDIYAKYFDDAIAADPNYIPVYYNLYLMTYRVNVNKGAEYLEKYLTLMGDDEPQACYYRTTIKYAQGLFAESLTQADACIAAGGAKPDARLYGLKGYAYDRLNDSVNAVQAFKKFFELENPEKIGPTDIETYSKNLLKFPGNEQLVGTLVDKGAAMDTAEVNKVTLLKGMAVRYESIKNYAAAADWYKKILNIRRNPTKTDIFNTANNYSRGGNYQASLDNWALYTAKYPNETYGYYMTATTQAKIDTSMELGLAIPNYQKVIDLGEAQWATDSVKVKAHLLNAYKYFIQYQANIKKDKKAAADFCARYLTKEPTDAEVANIQKQLSAPAAGGRTPAPVPATRPATGTKSTGGTPPAAGTNTKPTTTTGTKPAPPKKK
jgi:Flp pilus assembly protein TadD